VGLAVLMAILPAGCGSSSTHAAAAAVATPEQCAQTVAGTLGEVGERIYRTAASGADVAEAVHRVEYSAALVLALKSHSASATRAALDALLLNQIVRIEITRGGRVFAAAAGGTPALAPVRGSIPGTDAGFILSVQGDATFLQVARRLTGAQVLLLGDSGAGVRRVAGTFAGPPAASVPASGPLSVAQSSYQAVSIAAAAYPSGHLRIAMLVPSAAISCVGSTAQARVETLGHVGERIYQEELKSKDVTTTLGDIESSAAFRRAVAAANPVATHAAIDGFFKAHLHVVRVRVMIGSRLLVDIGGPYVLAPVHGVLRSGGRVIADFTMAIQDDAGYLKLARLFTGAEVLMRTGGSQVKGTLSPGPATLPARGAVSYAGHTYEAYSFTGEAFPSGPLHISLLL
jgi:hypothetical protein